MARYDEANTTRDEQLKKLEASYLGALERHMEKVRRAFPEMKVTVRIKADGEEVFEKELDWEKDEARIDLEFDPASKIEIEVGGDGRRAAWIYWTEFESR